MLNEKGEYDCGSGDSEHWTIDAPVTEYKAAGSRAVAMLVKIPLSEPLRISKTRHPSPVSIGGRFAVILAIIKHPADRTAIEQTQQ
jgi:hypothetical protein